VPRFDSIDLKGYFRNVAFRNYLELTDPKVMRALAHPVRMAILSHLADVGPATATECAEAAGASPSACSYHLRRLGEFGLVAEAPSEDGRERRWQLAVTGYGIPKEVQDRPEILAAMRPLTRRWIESIERVIEDYLANEHRYEPRWRKAATFQQTNPSVTPEELIRIGERIEKVFRPYQERRRPPRGAERIHASFVAVPWPATGRPGERTHRRKTDGKR
jgi:DNA-binding transcriptional ArsR family regulator